MKRCAYCLDPTCPVLIGIGSPGSKPKNLCAKTDPYEIWRDEWHVLKKWQTNDDKPYARWFCNVKGFCEEMGDVYVSNARRIK